MNYRPLANTGLEPSVICLGAGDFGSGIPQELANRILDAFVAEGGNFIDTARVYGAWLPNGAGLSERTLGAWLKRGGGRGDLILGTKGGHPDLQTMHISRLSPAEITADVTASLDALGVDCIDLYWLHRDDPAIPAGEILGALNEQLAAGRIRALGASNWTVERLQQAAAYAQTHRLTGFCASQINWSLARADMRAATYPGVVAMDAPTWAYHRQTGMALVAYSAQAQGFFSGKYDRGSRPQTPKGESVARLYFSAENFDRLERAQTLAALYGRTANEVALAYLFSQPFPVYPIVGCRTEEQVQASCAASALRLTAQDLAFLAAP